MTASGFALPPSRAERVVAEELAERAADGDTEETP